MNISKAMILTVGILGCFAFSQTGLAAGKPDLSGTWKLNIEKSNFGSMPAPGGVVAKVVHKEPHIHIDVSATSADGAENPLTLDLTTDGTEVTRTEDEWTITDSAHWEGATFVLSNKRKSADGEFSEVRKLELSSDGNTLTSATVFTTPQGSVNAKEVYEKQPE